MIKMFVFFRANQVAPRAGTPGFRSPEVLLKCPDQSTGRLSQQRQISKLEGLKCAQKLDVALSLT